ncbi:MAG: hypothetical protein MRY21_03320 [Simkaniaceae bacterium]|nr:hypothetical protein [Simkaniaceae bacterium]
MATSPYLIALYTLIPMAIAILGGLLASCTIPKKKFNSALQHLVAGIVLASVSVELLPKILNMGSAVTISIGFVLGVIAMLAVHRLAHYLSDNLKNQQYPVGLVIGSAIDLLIDGVIIGIAFIAGRGSGIFIALSLSLCGFFMNLSVGSTLSQRNQSSITKILSVLFVATMLPVGAYLGGYIIGKLPYYMLTETLAFGVAALLFLAIEELIGEAHRESHSNYCSLSFFLGFLAILLFKF